MNEKKKLGKVRQFFSDFKAFISKGNILDMAVGVIIGGAFGKIVTSLVNDIIMPLITLAVGGKSVEDWKWVIKEAEEGAAESALNYGFFLQSIIDFLIIAFCIFLVLRIIINLKMRAKKEEEGRLLFSNAERKQLKKEFIREGHSRKEAAALIHKREEELIAAAEAEKEAAAVVQAVETSEDVLKDIREILRQNYIQSPNDSQQAEK